MILTQLAIAGGVAYAGLRTYKLRSKKSFGQLLAADRVAVSHQAHNSKGACSLVAGNGDTEAALIQREQAENRHVAVSLVALGITSTATLAHAPIMIASLPFLGYLYFPIVKNLSQAIQKKKHVLLYSFEALLIGGELLAGYYLATALASTLYYISERALVKTERTSRQSLINVFGTQPRTAWVVSGQEEFEKDCDQLQASDIVVVHAGEAIPVDGTIVQGVASIDQHMLTGEAQPVEKGVGEQVLAPTIVLAGKLHIRVERTGRETTVAQIGDMLNKTAGFKEQLEFQSIAFSERFIVPTMLLGAVSYRFVGTSRAIALLESGFGYNMRVSGPMSMLNLLQVAAQQGILIKDGHAMEQLPHVDTVVFDKTGTLTLDEPHVGAIHSYNGESDAQVLAWAATAEYRQTHPIARAILAEARQRGIALPAIAHAEYTIGFGIKVALDNHTICVGSRRFLAMEGIACSQEIDQIQHTCYDQGYSLVLVALDGVLVGAIELHPTIRPEAQEIVQHLKQHNLQLYIISGDHEQPTRRLAHSLGIDHSIAEVLPQDKAAHVEQLQQAGHKVCFVGDGINDAIALKHADVSVSIRGASTAATDTANIVLMDGSLRQLTNLLDLGREYQTNMQGNKLMATVPSILCIGGIYIFKWRLVTAIMLYNTSLVASLGNAHLPLLMQKVRGDGREKEIVHARMDDNL